MIQLMIVFHLDVNSESNSSVVCVGDPTDDCNDLNKTLSIEYVSRWYLLSRPVVFSKTVRRIVGKCTEFLLDTSCPKKLNVFETEDACKDACAVEDSFIDDDSVTDDYVTDDSLTDA